MEDGKMGISRKR